MTPVVIVIIRVLKICVSQKERWCHVLYGVMFYNIFFEFSLLSVRWRPIIGFQCYLSQVLPLSGAEIVYDF